MEPKAEKTHPRLTEQELSGPRENPTEDARSTGYRDGVPARGGSSSLEKQEGEVEAERG